ncbi:FTR1 family protein [Actinomyces sp. zg-332]|uniref:FTR1 family iron permease n=1 Tax=Actinomyces sp. zg-332 TaxID=2708340 RepID=UPI0014220763|nr:FTR1 family protein [Actinomyces sp. zg-332]QPK94701.1 FTR1 family protein [Actinomyces sp. zg-332]
MVKTYLNKIFASLVVAFILFSGLQAYATNEYSDLFIKITDISDAIDKKDNSKAQSLLADIKTSFEGLPNSNSKAGMKVKQEILSAQNTLTKESIRKVSSALLSFEKEQNPVDEKAEKAKFESKVLPGLQELKTVVEGTDLDQMKAQYSAFNSLWVRNESFVRARSISHYGKIETGLSFLRSSMEMQPFSHSSVKSAYEDLSQAITDFLSGKKVSYSSDISTLEKGISVLEKGLAAFEQGKYKDGEQLLKRFIQSWPTFEGEVRTRNASLYSQVETQIPIISVKGKDKSNQKILKEIISQLSEINPKAQYTFVDSALILIREGVEALLIVIALVSALKAANQRNGLKWVYAGAAVGVLASCVLAVTLQLLFPTLTSGTNREVIEGIVGIVAVVFMISIGMWLHSKSSISAWKKFVDSKINVAISTGSFISMFTLSFLAVFREGAETIMFYVGIIPRISLTAFLLGIFLAIVLLLALAFIMLKLSAKIPIHLVFLVLTILIYGLAFKMLGVSIHILQLTDIFPSHILSFIPTVELLGIYPTAEGIISQLIFLFIIGVISIKKAFKVT